MRPDSSGVYQIRNLVNGKVYVGSAKYIRQRWYVHANELKKNKHHSVLQQRAYNKYGKAAFVYEVLDTCPPVKDILEFYEQHYLDALRPWDPTRGYNILRLANSPGGYLVTDEIRQKKSLSMKGKQNSLGVFPAEETRARMSAAKMGNTQGFQKGATSCRKGVHDPKVSGESNGGARLTEADVAKIFQSQLPSRELAHQYGVGKTTILRIRRGDTWLSLGLERKNPMHPPPHNPNSAHRKLTEADIDNILASPLSQKELAVSYGVNRLTINRALKRRTAAQSVLSA